MLPHLTFLQMEKKNYAFFMTEKGKNFLLSTMQTIIIHGRSFFLNSSDCNISIISRMIFTILSCSHKCKYACMYDFMGYMLIEGKREKENRSKVR